MSLAEVRELPYADWLDWGIYFGRKQQQRELAAARGKG